MKGSTLSFTLLFIGTICFIFASISWFNAVQRGSSEFDRISSICESMQDDDPRKLPCLQQRNEAMDTGNNAGTAVAFVPAMIGLVCFVFAIVSIKNMTKQVKSSSSIQSTTSPVVLNVDITNKLRDLAAMRDKGVIDEEEFQRIKTKLISQA